MSRALRFSAGRLFRGRLFVLGLAVVLVFIIIAAAVSFSGAAPENLMFDNEKSREEAIDYYLREVEDIKERLSNPISSEMFPGREDTLKEHLAMYEYLLANDKVLEDFFALQPALTLGIVSEINAAHKTTRFAFMLLDFMGWALIAFAGWLVASQVLTEFSGTLKNALAAPIARRDYWRAKIVVCALAAAALWLLAGVLSLSVGAGGDSVLCAEGLRFYEVPCVSVLAAKWVGYGVAALFFAAFYLMLGCLLKAIAAPLGIAIGSVGIFAVFSLSAELTVRAGLTGFSFYLPFVGVLDQLLWNDWRLYALFAAHAVVAIACYLGARFRYIRMDL